MCQCSLPRTEAETVVDRLAAQTVRSFREHHGLMVDDDFAYAFSSLKEAGQRSPTTWRTML